MLLRFLLVGVVTSLGLDAPTPTRMDCWTCQARSWWDARAETSAAPADVAPPAAVAVADETAATPEVADAVVEAAAPMPDDGAAFAAEPAVEAVAVAAEEDELVAPMPDDSAAFVADLEQPLPVEPAPSIDDVLATINAELATFAGEPESPMPQGLDAFAADPVTTENVETAALAASPADLQEFYEELAADPLAVLYPELDHETLVEEPAATVAEPVASRIEILDEEPAPAEAVTAAPTKDAKLTEAVRLTRQALRAWVGVLNAPAVVSVVQ